MDSNLFHLDWEWTVVALVGVILLSFSVERTPALIFKNRRLIRLSTIPE